MDSDTTKAIRNTSLVAINMIKKDVENYSSSNHDEIEIILATLELITCTLLLGVSVHTREDALFPELLDDVFETFKGAVLRAKKNWEEYKHEYGNSSVR